MAKKGKTKGYISCNRIRHLEGAMRLFEQAFSEIPGIKFDTIGVCTKGTGTGCNYAILPNGTIYKITFDGREALLYDAFSEKLITDAEIAATSQILTHAHYMKKDFMSHISRSR